MILKDIMITDVIKVHPETSLKSLMIELVEHKIGGVPVVNDDNQLVGMVSDGDVLRFVKPNTAKHYDFFLFYIDLDQGQVEDKIRMQLDRPVKDCMKRTNLITLSPDDGIDEVVDVLARHHFKKVPVIDESKRLVGVISRGDVIRYIVKQWIATN